MELQETERRFEDTLTWGEANKLRIIVSKHRHDALAELLVATHDGVPTGALEMTHNDAVILESKVDELFMRLSGAR